MLHDRIPRKTLLLVTLLLASLGLSGCLSDDDVVSGSGAGDLQGLEAACPLQKKTVYAWSVEDHPTTDDRGGERFTLPEGHLALVATLEALAGDTASVSRWQVALKDPAGAPILSESRLVDIRVAPLIEDETFRASTLSPTAGVYTFDWDIWGAPERLRVQVDAFRCG